MLYTRGLTVVYLLRLSSYVFGFTWIRACCALLGIYLFCVLVSFFIIMHSHILSNTYIWLICAWNIMAGKLDSKFVSVFYEWKYVHWNFHWNFITRGWLMTGCDYLILGNGLAQKVPSNYLNERWPAERCIYRKSQHIPKLKFFSPRLAIVFAQTQWSQVLSREWRYSWSSADRRCSNYIWVINNFIAH